LREIADQAKKRGIADQKKTKRNEKRRTKGRSKDSSGSLVKIRAITANLERGGSLKIEFFVVKNPAANSLFCDLCSSLFSLLIA
jgi:hypothetical protein